MQAYIFLLNKIADKIPDKDDKLFLKNNINEIAKDLFNFSRLFKKLNNVIMENIPLEEKIKKLSNIKFKNKKFSNNDSKEIIDAFNFNSNEMYGGAEEENIEDLKNNVNNELDDKINFCFSNMGLISLNLLVNFPKYGALLFSKFFKDVSDMYNFDWHNTADFSKKLDWVFLYLFILASLPGLGGLLFDIVIIIRAIKHERILLAVLTFITTWASLFVLHLIDLGAIIKLIYTLDVFSYTNFFKDDIPNELEDEVLNQDNDSYSVPEFNSNDPFNPPVKNVKEALETVKDGIKK